MTGQAYSASSEPNYRQWAIWAFFALGLIFSLWYACRSPEKPPPSEAAALEEPASSPSAGASRQDLAARLKASNSKLWQASSALNVAGERIGRLTDQIERFRREAGARGDYFPPPTTDVRHIGSNIYLREDGQGWQVEGEWFNLGETRATGYAEVQLRLNGRPAGEVQRVSMSSIPVGERLAFQTVLPRVPGDDTANFIDAKVTWVQQ